ncbi:MAG: GNAT family N-acetyltransferase [Lewinellaceae bacterium]|nr:GNAT family N-acetyltransferase [Lewinellaceae bacterium]
MISLSIADESHTSEVATLIAALFAEVGHTPDEEEIASVFADVDADEGHSTLLALDDDGEVVGIMTVATFVSLYAGGKIGVINELYVLPDFRSEGVGKMLLDFAKEIGEDQGWVRLEVTTPGDEYDKTLRFYEREGFHRIGPRYKYEI